MTSDSDGIRTSAATVPGANVTVLFEEDANGRRQISFRLSGQPGRRYVVEYSDDLIKWSPLSGTVIENQILDIQDLNGSASSQRFYRLAPVLNVPGR